MKAVINKFVESPRVIKQSFLVVLDFLAFPILLWLCYTLREFDLGAAVMPNLAFSPMIVSVISVGLLFCLGVYRFIVRSFSEAFMTRLAIATLLMMITLYLMAYFTPAYIPTSIPVVYGFVLFMWVWLSRGFIRFLIQSTRAINTPRKRIAIYGAGGGGQQIAAALNRSDSHLPVFFIDDNPSYKGQMIGGLTVYLPHQVKKAIQKTHVDEILIALPSVGRERKNDIIKSLESTALKITEIPGLTKLVDGEIQLSDIREVDIVDLLGRDPVPPIQSLLDKNIFQKVVMVTGAGGSIGSELCRQIFNHQPKCLILYELTEFALYRIERELSLHAQAQHIALIPILGTVLDQEKLERVIEQYGVQTVYHAAAYKHVPLVEANPIAGIKNNALGTAYSVNAAVKKGVETFVLISTDKAVRPTNVMGATKRMAELYCQAMAAAQSTTQISSVRFGNVLGSSGSVVPLFKKQIAQGGPITVTHPDVTRYFMTIPEASQLVIQAGALGTGGDVFLLDMGESVRIQDLARQMIALSGLRVKEEGSTIGDIAIQYTGLRPGEKLYEELLIDQDNTEYTAHKRILRSVEKQYPLEELQPIFNRLALLGTQDDDVNWMLSTLEHYVDGYYRSNQFNVN